MQMMQGYRERIAYDPNGRLVNNQLVRVRVSVNSAEYLEDIDDQPVNNYFYDAIGHLVRDSAEGISQISWTVYGKIRQMNKRDDAIIRYEYDACGNRIGKSVARPSCPRKDRKKKFRLEAFKRDFILSTENQLLQSQTKYHTHCLTQYVT